MDDSSPPYPDDPEDPYRAIRIGDPGMGEATKWGQALTLFMRVIAVFWMFQGLMLWRVILMSPKPIFNAMPSAAAFAVIFFAVLDLVASVGLWLATPWGGVMWLLIASAQMFVAANMPGFFTGGYWLIGIDAILIALYFLLTYEAGRDFEANRFARRPRRRGEPPQKPGSGRASRFGWLLRLLPAKSGPDRSSNKIVNNLSEDHQTEEEQEGRE